MKATTKESKAKGNKVATIEGIVVNSSLSDIPSTSLVPVSTVECAPSDFTIIDLDAGETRRIEALKLDDIAKGRNYNKFESGLVIEGFFIRAGSWICAKESLVIALGISFDLKETVIAPSGFLYIPLGEDFNLFQTALFEKRNRKIRWLNSKKDPKPSKYDRMELYTR